MAKLITTGFISDTINGIKVNSSIKCNKSNYNNKALRTVGYIVMHYTGNSKDTAKANANYFNGANRGASAHFLVDDNNIYQSVELRDVAWHCGANKYKHSSCRNNNSIGIEMCCSGDYKVSEETKENAAYLAANLCKRLGITADKVDSYIVRHYDVTGKSCPAQMVSNNKEWVAFKNDVKEILTLGALGKGYLVKIAADVLNVREGAGTKYKVVTTVKKNEVYTIVEEKNGWGKLKSGKGWISLSYTTRV